MVLNYHHRSSLVYSVVRERFIASTEAFVPGYGFVIKLYVEWKLHMCEFSARFNQPLPLYIARTASIASKVASHFYIVLMVFLFGCKSPLTPPPVAEKVSVTSSSGALLTLTAQVKGTVSSDAGRTIVTTGRAFQIDGELKTPCKVGDLVHLDLRHQVGPNKWSSLANAVTKVESVHDGIGRFSTEFFITDVGDRDGRMNVELCAPDTDNRTDAGSVDVGIRSDR